VESDFFDSKNPLELDANSELKKKDLKTREKDKLKNIKKTQA
jgi:hypothetical protein